MKYIFYKKTAVTDGFTLVETMVTIAIFVIVMLALFDTIAMFYRYNSYTIAQSYQVSYARTGMNSFIRDVRQMTYGDNGAFPLAVMEPNKIGFYSNVDDDDNIEYVEYELASSTLTKRVYKSTSTPPTYSATPSQTQVVARYVQNSEEATSTFYYYNSQGQLATSTTSAADIVYVRARIVVNIDPERNPGEFTIENSASLRNLKKNK